MEFFDDNNDDFYSFDLELNSLNFNEIRSQSNNSSIPLNSIDFSRFENCKIYDDNNKISLHDALPIFMMIIIKLYKVILAKN